MDASGAADELPPVRFIPFDKLKERGSFPRFPDDAYICVNLEDIDLENSLLIYISHCWLRSWSGAEGWDGRPHPDNANGGKYLLCIDGIEQILKTQAPGFKACYVWIDYSCRNQDSDHVGQIQQMDRIVGACDCLFTPIYDANHTSWSMATRGRNVYEMDQSEGWRGNAYSYLSRGWCRMEMFYGSNIPLYEESENRKQKMRAGLLQYKSGGMRPQFLYGSKYKAERRPPLLLPPFANSYFEEYHPAKGNVAVDADKAIILALVKELEPFMRKRYVHRRGGQRTSAEEGQRDYLGKQLLVAAQEGNLHQLETVIEEGAEADYFLEVNRINDVGTTFTIIESVRNTGEQA
jgi:hypothetical protein